MNNLKILCTHIKHPMCLITTYERLRLSSTLPVQVINFLELDQVGGCSPNDFKWTIQS